MSFKMGEFEGERDGRFYRDILLDNLQKEIMKFSQLSRIELYESKDYSRSISWINIVFMNNNSHKM